MAQCSITLTAKIAPWVKWYIGSIVLFARLMGMTPDPDKVAKTVRRGIRIHITRNTHHDNR